MAGETDLRWGNDENSLGALRSSPDTDDGLFGTSGFAGTIDGIVIRDVLGRVPLFVERDRFDWAPAVERAGRDAPLGAVEYESARDLPTDEVFGVLQSAGSRHNDQPFDDSRSGDTTVSDSRSGNTTFSDSVPGESWSHRPTALTDPVTLPAGCAATVTTIEPVWQLTHPPAAADQDAVVDRIDAAIRSGVDRAATASSVVAFSGGVDSALLAATCDRPLYVVGFPDSHDVDAAHSAARAMGVEDRLHCRTLSIDDVERAVPTVARAIGRTNAMDVAIALGMYLVAEAAADDGYDRLLCGQGADELFGGYEKVGRLDHRVEATSVRDAVFEQIRTVPEQVSRDVLAIEAAGVRPIVPYLGDDVVAPALTLSESRLVSASTRKVTLRRIAAASLPRSVAYREKKALQYGSLVSRELDRLARQAGYKRRMDDHVRRYVESRL